MNLKEVMEKFDGHAERLPEDQIASGKEVDLGELTKVLDAWKDTWDKLNPQTVDRRRHQEQIELKRALKQHLLKLKGMTFKLSANTGYPREFIRAHIDGENPEKEKRHIIKELFDSGSWYLLIARVKGNDGSDHLDYCHVNTREVFRLNISADLPIIGHYDLIDPANPSGNIIVF